MTTETTSPARPAKRPRKRKTTRASFGSVHRLPSGRYQAQIRACSRRACHSFHERPRLQTVSIRK